MRKLAPVLFAVLLFLSSSQAQAPSKAPSPADGQAQAPTALVADPCPPAPPAPPVPAVTSDPAAGPGRGNGAPFSQAARGDLEAFRKAQDERAKKDWPYLCRYRAANAALSHSPKVVLMGDSITEGWVRADPSLFGDDVVGRGISGQTSPQMLLRFFQDVIALKPQVVHIMTGTNDIAGNTGPTTEQAVEDNIIAMVELAKAHHIRVVLASILPSSAFPWNPPLRPAATIVELNQWLRSYASESGSQYVDYYSVLADSSGGFRKELSVDGVHPNRDGFALMRPLFLSAIDNKGDGKPSKNP